MPKNDKFIYQGFDKPDANFFRLPREWTDITAKLTSLAEMKVVEYVLKHTWGYQEFGMVKKITTEEFMNGRKTNKETRLDTGTGLSKPSVIDGLKSAVLHGLLVEEIDMSDKARIKKSYALKMKDFDDLEESEEEENSENSEPNHADVKNVYTGVKNLHIRGKESSHRSEIDTLERNNNVEKKRRKSEEETEYYAGLIADKLNDRKSMTYYKIMCKRLDPKVLLEKAAEIMGDGGARNPGAVFSKWVQTQLKG